MLGHSPVSQPWVISSPEFPVPRLEDSKVWLPPLSFRVLLFGFLREKKAI